MLMTARQGQGLLISATQRTILQPVAAPAEHRLATTSPEFAACSDAIAHQVTAVGDRTQYGSGWYGCGRTVLGWFLDVAGIEATRQEDC